MELLRWERKHVCLVYSRGLGCYLGRIPDSAEAGDLLLYRGEPSQQPQRFDWIVQGASEGPNFVFDEDLASFADAAVIPTRGALVPEWLLVVPREPSLSVAAMRQERRLSLLKIAEIVAAKVAAAAGASVVFEHGPGRPGAVLGCEVDQAHLHVVGGASDLLDRLKREVGEVCWTITDFADPWEGIPQASDYLMVRDSSRAILASVEDTTSQRLRRALAQVLGRGREWDYRAHPQELNARRTKEMFRGAFTSAIPLS